MAFIVPVRNDAAGIERCLTAIASNVPAPASIEMIVINNGSVDGSDEKAAAFGACVVTAAGKVASLRNHGARLTQADLLAFVDADHAIDSRWVRCALELFEDPGVAAAGAPYLPAPGSTWVQRSYDAFRDHRLGVVDAEWLGSGNLVVRRECFEALGGFDERLETCEDVDLCKRLKSRGYRVLSDSRLRSVHYGDPRTLNQLFVGELWRGRDNLRVSLRGRVSLRDLPSILIPLIDLACIAFTIAAVVAWQSASVLIVCASLATVAGLATLKAARMARRLTARGPLELLRVWSVAFVYDLARAMALVSRVRHRRASPATGAVR